jgi:hypothetical protein
MAVQQPTMTSVTRPSALVGSAVVSDVPLGVRCDVYYIPTISAAPGVYLGGSVVGDGNPLTVPLALTHATINFFGWVIGMPFQVFAVNFDPASGESSIPSANVLPVVFNAFAAPTVSARRVSGNSQKLRLVVSGLPDNTYEIYVFWSTPTGTVIMEKVTGNGSHTLAASFAPGYPYALTCFGISPTGSFSLPAMAVEPWVGVTITPARLNSVEFSPAAQSVIVTFTPAVGTAANRYAVLYRNLTVGQESWDKMEVTASPATLTGLTRGAVYEVCVVACDLIGRASLPTRTVDVHVRY